MAFKAKVEQVELENALKKVKGPIGKGKYVNNEKYVYMETILEPNSGNQVLKLITSNTNEISEIIVDVISAEIGVSPLIEYDKLFNMIATIDNSVEIELEDSGDNKLSLNYTGRTKPITFNGAEATNYVAPPSIVSTSSIVLPMQILKEGFDAATLIINDHEMYPTFNCVNIDIKNGIVEFQAFDSKSKRMLIYSKPTTHTNEGTFYIENSKVKRMASGFDSTKDVTLHLSHNNVMFEQDSLNFTIRLLEGNYPDLNTHIPNQYAVEVLFDKQEMLASLNRAKIMMSQDAHAIKSVVYNIDQSFITINMNSVYGQLCETVVCTLKGSPLQMAFLIDPLISTLNSFEDDDLKLCFFNKKGGVLMPATQNGFVHKTYISAILLSNN